MYSEDEIIQKALEILATRLTRETISLSSPATVKNFLIASIAQEEREVFGVIWLDVKNRVIANEVLFYGSLTHAAVYPREVVKAGLKHNCASVIIYHNHPSGNCDPSQADLDLTKTLKAALSLVDIRTLDHIIVGSAKTHSFAENGQI